MLTLPMCCLIFTSNQHPFVSRLKSSFQHFSQGRFTGEKFLQFLFARERFYFAFNSFCLRVTYLLYLWLCWVFVTYLFYLWLCWIFIAGHGLSLVTVSKGSSSLQCAGFSLWWLLLLQTTGSRPKGFRSCSLQAQELRLQALECKPNSWGSRAQLLCGMWDPPGPGIEPTSPTLAGRFLTNGPPGKPLLSILKYTFAG